MKLYWLLLFGFIVSGCSSAPAPKCASTPDLSRLTQAEQIALKHSIRANSKNCHSSQYECAFQLTHNRSNELVVTTSFLYPDKNSGQCVQPIGGSEINVYDSNGRFQRAVLSL